MRCACMKRTTACCGNMWTIGGGGGEGGAPVGAGGCASSNMLSMPEEHQCQHAAIMTTLAMQTTLARALGTLDVRSLLYKMYQ